MTDERFRRWCLDRCLRTQCRWTAMLWTAYTWTASGLSDRYSGGQYAVRFVKTMWSIARERC